MNNPRKSWHIKEGNKVSLWYGEQGGFAPDTIRRAIELYDERVELPVKATKDVLKQTLDIVQRIDEVTSSAIIDIMTDPATRARLRCKRARKDDNVEDAGLDAGKDEDDESSLPTGFSVASHINQYVIDIMGPAKRTPPQLFERFILKACDAIDAVHEHINGAPPIDKRARELVEAAKESVHDIRRCALMNEK